MPGGGGPEIEEVQRGQRLEHVHLGHHQALNRIDAVQPREHGSELAPVNAILRHDRHDRIELDENLLEPQLVGLVHHYEEVLVVDEPPRSALFGVCAFSR